LSRVIGLVVDRVVFRNDEGHGSAFLVTTIAALESLRRHSGLRSDLPEQLNVFDIAGSAGYFARWFPSPPLLEERIERLRNAV
jgi:hypothetical protein